MTRLRSIVTIILSWIFRPAIKWAVAGRAEKLGVSFGKAKGPYVLFQGRQVDLRTASNAIDELLYVLLVGRPFVEDGKVYVIVNGEREEPPVADLTREIIAGRLYAANPDYLRLRREQEKRRAMKYMPNS